ncbi:MAG: LuxR family transcriptional regulator, partial [Chloroflexi bacterium]|nr:LuxR family transcriptional regulator [Chloroflexota bacterium]
MLTTILTTKLYIPPPRPGMVPRHHLIEQLNAGRHGKLTLISAPAGFGKTTLLSEWIAGGDLPAAWLSLDAGDSDLAHFLTYLVAALRTLAPQVGEGVAAGLQSPQPPPPETLLTSLLNDIAASPDDFLLVLDDYHVLDSAPVDEALTFLLEYLPPQLHLV